MWKTALIFTDIWLTIHLSSALLSNNLNLLADKHLSFDIRGVENETFFQFPSSLKDFLASSDKGDKECNVKLTWLDEGKANGEQLPFVIEKDKGISVIAGHTLNCQTRHTYDCVLTKTCAAVAKSEDFKTKTVQLKVILSDANRYKPFFTQDIYETNYVEGYGQNYLLKVTAFDQDCVNNHLVCDYKILSTSHPFQINKEGMIWPTQPLDGQVTSKYEFQVVGIDCTGGGYSDPATVLVQVHRECKARFSVDTSKQFDIQHPFRNLKLELCPFCNPIDIFARVGFDFDDPALVKCTSRICDKPVDDNIVLRLLQSYDPQESNLPSPSITYVFNGHDDMIPIKNSDITIDKLTEQGGKIKFWMRLLYSVQNPAAKRQILCESDKTAINRQRFSVYLHGDFLNFLYRHEPMDPPANHEFFPSEWSWNISSLIVDTQWHHYEIDILYPTVQLTVDFNSTHHWRLHKVINEWPMSELKLPRPGSKDESTALTVGACWQGMSKKYIQHFAGELAALHIILSSAAASRMKPCAQECSQRMEIDDKLSPDVAGHYAFNERKNVIFIRSRDMESIRRVFNAIKYIQPDDPVALSVFLNGTVVCENTPKMKISDLWLRDTGNMKKSRITNNNIDNNDKVRNINPDQQDANLINSGGNGAISTGNSAGSKDIGKAIPGYVYSGWMFVAVAVGLTLIVGSLFVVGAVKTRYRQTSFDRRWLSTFHPLHHHQQQHRLYGPTGDELEWEEEDSFAFNNPLKLQQLKSLNIRDEGSRFL